MHVKMLNVALCLSFAVAMVLGRNAIAADELGPYPAEIAAWDEAEKARQRAAGEELLAKLQAAIEAKATTFNIPKGDYRFSKIVNPNAARWGQTHILIRGAEKMTIEGNGSTFWFETGTMGVYLQRCREVTLKNVFMDRDPLPFIQGKVVSVDASKGTVVVKPDKGYERTTPEFLALTDPAQAAPGSKIRFQVQEQDKPRWKRGSVGMRADPFFESKAADGTYTIKVHPFLNRPLPELNVAAGDPFTSWMRDGHAVTISECDAVTLENVVVYSAPFISYMEAATDRRTTYRGCKIAIRPDTNRRVAGNADGFQIANAMEGPLIENCEIESIGDDFVNPHGYYYRVLAQESSTSVLVDPIGYRQKIAGTVDINFFTRPGFEDLGSRKAAVEQTTYEFGTGNPLLKTATKWAAGGNSSMPKAGAKLPAMRLKLDRPIDLPPDSVISCTQYVSRGTVIRNNRFIGSLAKGVRVLSPDMVVENNWFEWVTSGCLFICAQGDYWGESDYGDRAVIRNNTIVDPFVYQTRRGTSDYAIGVGIPGDLNKARWVRDVTIEGNTIRGASRNAIELRGIEGLVLRNNVIEEYGLRPYAKAGDTRQGGGEADANVQKDDTAYAIYLDHVSELKMGENKIGAGGSEAKAGNPVYKDRVTEGERKIP